MGKIFWGWISAKAKWWEFWLPDSGLIGGIIFGLIIGLIVTICLSLTGCRYSPSTSVGPDKQDTVIVGDSVKYPTMGEP